MARAVVRQMPAPSGDDPRDDRWVRAAGGVLLRTSGKARLEVALVHRPGREDWSLPKGKLDRRETFEQGALREVLEETGYSCVLGRFAGSTQYVDRRGRPKLVAYWFMEPSAGTSFDEPATVLTDEVDEVRWLELPLALRALSYPHDQELLARLGSADLARFA